MDAGKPISVQTKQTGLLRQTQGHRTRLNLPPAAAWMLPRALATLGALLFAAGALLPWVTITYSFGAGSPEYVTSIPGSDGLGYLITLVDATPSERLLEAALWAWWAVFIAGLLLCPILWQRLSGRATRVSSLLFTGWVAVATVFATVAANAILHELSSQAFEPIDYNMTIVRHDPQWGLAFAVLGLGLSWIAAALLRDEPIREVATHASRRSPVQSLAAVLTSAGVLVWALGFVALPWASVNCSGLVLSLNHYVSGSCGALDAGDALAYTFAGGSLLINDLNGTIPTLIYAVLAGGGLLVLLASWRLRGLSRGLTIWMTAWFGAALVAAALALKGVPIILRVRPQLASQTIGDWTQGSGVFVAFAGLALVAGGLMALWLLALRYSPRLAPA